MAMRLAATLHKGATRRADAVTTRQAFAMATLDGARALGLEGRIGSLEEGKAADMVLVTTDRAHAQPLFDPLTHLVYSTAKSDVTDVWVGGAPVVPAWPPRPPRPRRDPRPVSALDARRSPRASRERPEPDRAGRRRLRGDPRPGGAAGRRRPHPRLRPRRARRRGRGPDRIPYAEIAGYPRSTAPGHAGRLVIGRLHGARVALAEGRAISTRAGRPATWRCRST
jgi:hypothetical protein